MSAQNAPVSNRGELSMSFDASNRNRMMGAKVLGAGVLGAGVAMACLGLAAAQPTPPDAPAYAANGDLLLPQKFETWVFAGSNLGLGYAPDVPNNTRAEAARQVTGRAGRRQVAGCAAACAIDGSPLLRGSGIVFTAEP